MPTSTAEMHELHPQLAAQVADLLAHRIEERERRERDELVDVRTVCEHFNLTKGMVYAHAAEFGAVRIGDGPRAQLWFTIAGVRDGLAAMRLKRPTRSAASPSTIKSRPRRRKAAEGTTPSGNTLLPLREAA